MAPKKQTDATPKASGGRTLASSPANVTAEPTGNDAASRRQTVRTLADRIIDADDFGVSKSAKRSYESDDGDDDDYVDTPDIEDGENYGKTVGGRKAERKGFLGRLSKKAKLKTYKLDRKEKAQIKKVEPEEDQQCVSGKLQSEKTECEGGSKLLEEGPESQG